MSASRDNHCRCLSRTVVSIETTSGRESSRKVLQEGTGATRAFPVRGNDRRTGPDVSEKTQSVVFEELVLEALKDNGFRVCRNKRYSGDGGIDGRVFKNGEEYYVQCKRYASHIDMQHVRDFVELCRKDGKSGLFVHTGKTGRGAWNVLSDGPSTVEIISGGKLLNLLAKNTKQSL